VDSVDIGDIQWCEHLKVECERICTFAVAHISNMRHDLIVSKGTAYLCCELCSPHFLAMLRVPIITSSPGSTVRSA